MTSLTKKTVWTDVSKLL